VLSRAKYRAVNWASVNHEALAGVQAISALLAAAQAPAEDKASLDLIRRLAAWGTAALNGAARSETAVAEGTVPSTRQGRPRPPPPLRRRPVRAQAEQARRRGVTVMPSHRIEVCLEVTPKQAFASALEWPGWCRAGRDEGAALKVLARYSGRYAPVAAHAGVSFPATVAFDVAERVPGGPATAFAAPECRRPFPQITTAADRATVTPAAARRLAGLLAAVWATFDDIAAASPAELRKGPRGGGRDRDQIIGHVIGADTAYARKLGIKLKQPPLGDTAAIAQLREAIAAVLSAPSDGSPVVPGGWDTRYAARRIAWHLLEHAWEMQDRADS
jgi:hypothetical protein